MNTYPENVNTSVGKNNIAIQIYGDRIHLDQSLYEYLIEFLLVFSSYKNIEVKSGAMKFHQTSDDLSYYVYPRIGLKRFVFYERAKKGRKIEADEKAYHEICRILENNVIADTPKQAREFVESIQDLLHGYSAVLKNRSWCAQATLPICPELIFCEEMPVDKKRIEQDRIKWDASIDDETGFREKITKIDSSFDNTRHNFLARGGEIYYLHILQGLETSEGNKRAQLERGLKNSITARSHHFSNITNWIQSTWESEMKLNPKHLVEKMKMEFIPATGYIECASYTIDELIVFLSNEMHPIKRIELLAKGVMFQIMRLMTSITNEYLGSNHLPWIVDMKNNKTGGQIKKLATQSFNRISDSFINAINKRITEFEEETGKLSDQQKYKYLCDAKKETLDVFKSKGKELQCVIPSRGPMERFSLSEDIVKFMVLSIVKPGEKMTLDMFLAECFEHFSLVIGPEEYKKCIQNSNLDIELTNCFVANMDSFQDYLKDTGFLRDLSDATSIVVNPYSEVQYQ